MDPVVKPQEDGQCRRMTVVIYRGRTGLPRCCALRKDECVSAGGAMGFRLRGNDGDEIEDGFQFIRHPRAGGDPMLGYALRADAKLRALRARYRMTVVDCRGRCCITCFAPTPTYGIAIKLYQKTPGLCSHSRAGGSP